MSDDDVTRLQAKGKAQQVRRCTYVRLPTVAVFYPHFLHSTCWRNGTNRGQNTEVVSCVWSQHSHTPFCCGHRWLDLTVSSSARCKKEKSHFFKGVTCWEWRLTAACSQPLPSHGPSGTSLLPPGWQGTPNYVECSNQQEIPAAAWINTTAVSGLTSQVSTPPVCHFCVSFSHSLWLSALLLVFGNHAAFKKI